MSDFFRTINSIPPPFNMVVWIVLITCVTGIVTSIAKEIRKFVCYQQDLQFKRELIDQGLDVSEIERVVSARPKNKS